MGRRESGARVTVRGTLEQAQRAFQGLAFVTRVEAVAGAPLAGLTALRLAFDGDAAPERLEQLAAACHGARLPLSRLEAEATRLEDVFADLTESAAAPPPAAS